MRCMSLLAACVIAGGLVAPAVGQGAPRETAPKVIVGDSTQRRMFEDFLQVLPALTSPLIYLLANN